MKKIKVAAAALNQLPLDFTGNTQRILDVILEARGRGVQFLCLPELAITGYGCEDAFYSIDVLNHALKQLNHIKAHVPENMVVSVGLPLLVNNTIYNANAILYRGLQGYVAKQNLASDGIHYEPRWFKPWPKGMVLTTENLVGEAPVGDLIFNFDGVKLGIEICEDSWAVERSGSNLSKRGVDIIFNPSASHFALGKDKIREQLVIEGSRAFRCTYVYSNLLGNEAGRAIYGGDTLIASGGKLIARGPQLSFKDTILTTAIIDVDTTKTHQIMNGSFRAELDKTNEIYAYYKFNEPTKFESDNKIEKILSGDYYQFSHAVALGLFDYMRKSHSNGFVVSLSGGMDSCAVSYLVRQMYDFGIKELGKEEFWKKSGLKGDIPENIMENLLTCVYQKTKNSSKDTLNTAKNFAEGIGAIFYNWKIDSVIDQYTKLIEKSFERNLSWDSDDIALQNIQARVRSPGIWMLANIKNALLLTTSNRSEAAVGYCTLDGDTCGGLSPIGGIDKDFLKKWFQQILRNLNVAYKDPEGLKGFLVEKAIESILSSKPTAELRPGNSQTDEDDLMPYDILNEIEKAAIRDKKLPLSVFETLKDNHPDTDEKILSVYVEKFFRLWIRNQYKRERLAPSFHLDDESLDPKTWCRWPILCSNLDFELNSLKKEDKNDE